MKADRLAGRKRHDGRTVDGRLQDDGEWPAAAMSWFIVRLVVTPAFTGTRQVFIARQHTDARYWYSKYVRLFVRYVRVSDENGLTYRHSYFHHTVAQ